MTWSSVSTCPKGRTVLSVIAAGPSPSPVQENRIMKSIDLPELALARRCLQAWFASRSWPKRSNAARHQAA